MFDHQLTIFRFQYGYGQKLLADIPDSEFKKPVFPGANPPSWIVGHLAVAVDFVPMLLGQPTLCPKNWVVMFGPASDPMKYLEKHPSRAELMAAYVKGHDYVFEVMKHADPVKLKEPSPFKPLINELPTAGDLLTHLITSHEAFHVSQLSACRRVAGFGPLF
jgi:hypothetical protein